MTIYKEYELASGLRNGVEAFAIPINIKAKKKYLLGELVMADAFIAWANVNATRFQSIETPWRAKFHLYSLPIVGLLIFSIFRRVRIWK